MSIDERGLVFRRFAEKALKEGEPGLLNRVLVSESLTEGSLGGRLAQRQAALREVMAAGSRLLLRACRQKIEHVACHGNSFSGNEDGLDVRAAPSETRGHGDTGTRRQESCTAGRDD